METIDQAGLNELFEKAKCLWRRFEACFPSSLSERQLDELYDEWLIHCTLPFTPLTSVGRVLSGDDRAGLYQNWREQREERERERRAKAAKEVAHKAVKIAVYEAAKQAAHKAALQAIGRDDLEGATDEQYLTYDDVYESEMTAREGAWLESHATDPPIA
jgi:hypothetical protein